MHQVNSFDLGPGPILEVFDAYQGSFTDLEHGICIDGGALRATRDELARQMAARGLASGERVVVTVGNGPLFPAILTALLDRGASPLLLHVDTPPAELQRMATSYGARWIVSETRTADELSEFVVDSAMIAAGDWARLLWAEVDTRREGFNDTYPAVPGVPLHPTSGTTGRPKLAGRTGRCAVNEANNYIGAMQVDDSDSVLCITPMSHGYSYGVALMVPLISGARVFSLRRFNPRLVARALDEQRITTLPAVPAMLDLLLAAYRNGLPRVPRRIFSAGAPLPSATAEAFFERNGARVRPLYGTTETGGITVAPAGDDVPAGPCVGPPMQNVEAEIRPLKSDAGMSEGIGQVCIRTTSMMAGYLTPEGFDDSMLEDGWFVTGDLGHLDERGQIHLVGRETEVINVFGMKVVPSEVEEVIAGLTGVRDVKVYAADHAGGSQIVKAAVALDDGVDVATVRAHCEQQLAPFKRPTAVVALEKLPRSPMGKIIRDQLP